MSEEEFRNAPISNVLEKYDHQWCDSILEIKKWKKKDKKLQQFIDLIRNQKFNPK